MMIITELMLKKYKIMEIKVLKTEENYNQALKRFEVIFHAPSGTKKGDEHFHINAPGPIEAIKFRM